MEKYWREYYILYSGQWCLQLKNNYHYFAQDEWYLISIHYAYRSGGRDYFIGLLGLQLRLFKYSRFLNNKPSKD